MSTVICATPRGIPAISLRDDIQSFLLSLLADPNLEIVMDSNGGPGATSSKTSGKAVNPPQDASEGSNPPTYTDSR
jgi:hypothetical protein